MVSPGVALPEVNTYEYPITNSCRTLQMSGILNCKKGRDHISNRGKVSSLPFTKCTSGVSRPQPKIEPLRIQDGINSTVRPPSSWTEILNFLLFSPWGAPLHFIMHEGDVRFELDASSTPSGS